MGQKSDDFRYHVKQQKHVANVFSRRRHTATKLTGLASFARISLPPMLRRPHLPNPKGWRGQTWHTYSTLYVVEDTVNSLPTFHNVWATRWTEYGPKWQNCKFGTFFQGALRPAGGPFPQIFCAIL